MSATKTIDTPRGSVSGAAPRHALLRAAVLVPGVVLVIVLLVLPKILDEEYRNVANLCLLAAMGALALNLVIGEAGQVSVASAAFLAVGGYGASTAAVLWHWPVLAAVLFGAVIGTVIGALVGLPSLRLRGLYLLVATLALHYVVVYAAQRFQTRFAGPAGFLLPQPRIAGVTIQSYTQWYYLLLVVVAVLCVGFYNLKRSSFGRALKSIKDTETAAGVLGINVAAYKISAFAVSAFVASLGGALQAYYQQSVSFESFTLNLAIQFVAMIIIGGLGTIAGSLIGAAVFTALPYLIQSNFSGLSPSNVSDVQGIIFGAAMALILLFAPNGLAGMVSALGGRLAGGLRRIRTAKGSGVS